MKTVYFVLLLTIGMNASASEPSLQQIVNGYFRYAQMQVTDVEINELENPFASSQNKEIFFRYNNIYYNCTLDLPTVNYNRVGQGYIVSSFEFTDCQNFDTGVSIEMPDGMVGNRLVSRQQLAAQVDFKAGVVFYNNNTQILPRDVFFSRERIGDPPRPNR